MNPAPPLNNLEQLKNLIPLPIPDRTLSGTPDCRNSVVQGIITQRTILMDTLIRGQMKPTDKLQSADTCRSLLELTAVLSHERATNLPQTPEGQIDPLDRAVGLLMGSFTHPPKPDSRFSYAKDIYALLPKGERLTDPEEIKTRFVSDVIEIDKLNRLYIPIPKELKQRVAVSSLRMISLIGSTYDLKREDIVLYVAKLIRNNRLGEEIGELIGLRFGGKSEGATPPPPPPEVQAPPSPDRIGALVDGEGFAADIPHLENLKKVLLSDTGQNWVMIDEHTFLRGGETPRFSLAELMENTRSPDSIRILASTGKTTLVAIRVPAVNTNEPPNVAIIAVRQNQPPYLLKYEDERMEIYLGKDRPEHLNDAWRRQSTENTIFYISGSSYGSSMDEVKRLFILKDTGEIITYDTNKENVYFEITNTSDDKMTGIETTIGDEMTDKERRKQECRFIYFDGKNMQVDSVTYQGIQPSEGPCFGGIGYTTVSADGRESALIEDKPGHRKPLISSPEGISLRLSSFYIPESLRAQLAEVSLHAGNISGIPPIEADCINSTTLLVQKLPDGTYRTGLISRRDRYKLNEPAIVTTDPDRLESTDDKGETLVLHYQSQEPGQPGLWVREATETDITSGKELSVEDIARIIRKRACQSTNVTSQFTHIPAGWLHPNEMANHLESVEHFRVEELAPPLLEIIRQEKLKAADELMKVVLDNIRSTESSENFDELVRRLKLLKFIKTASRSEEEIYREDLVPMPAQWDGTDPENLDAMIQSRTALILHSRRSTPKDLWAKSGTPALDEVCARAALEQIALYSWYAPDRSPKAIMGDLYYLTGVIDNKPQSHYSAYSFSGELFSILSAHDPENMMKDASQLHRVWKSIQPLQKQIISDTPNRTDAAKRVIYTLACLGDPECMTSLTAERTQLILNTLSEIISFQKLGPELAGLVKIPSPDKTLTARL